MEKAAEVLIIIVSATLAVFLIVLTVLLVKLYKVVKSLEHIAEKAEQLANSAEAIGSFFKKAATPVSLGRFMYNVSQSVFHHGKNAKKGNEE